MSGAGTKRWGMKPSGEGKRSGAPVGSVHVYPDHGIDCGVGSPVVLDGESSGPGAGC